jgi:hypothetical protein
MTVILLFLIFVAIGYLFAFTSLGDQIEEIGSGAVNKAKATVRRTGPPAAGVQIETASPVGEWVKKSTAVPDEFRGWYLSLAQPEAQRFEKALNSHAQETQLRFSLLFNGELDRQPERRKVYVEAVSVYSQAYRKAREALEKDEELSGESLEPADDGTPTVEGKVVAEKSVSRRHRDSGEFAPAG